MSSLDFFLDHQPPPPFRRRFARQPARPTACNMPFIKKNTEWLLRRLLRVIGYEVQLIVKITDVHKIAKKYEKKPTGKRKYMLKVSVWTGLSVSVMPISPRLNMKIGMQCFAIGDCCRRRRRHRRFAFSNDFFFFERRRFIDMYIYRHTNNMYHIGEQFKTHSETKKKLFGLKK